MKKYILILITMLLCTANSVKAQQHTGYVKTEFRQGGFIFKIDPRNQALYSLFMILGYPNTYAANLRYKNAILEKFGPYKNSPEVKAFESHFRKYWNDLTDPSYFAVQFDNDFNLLPGADSSFVAKNGGKESISNAGKLVKSYIDKSGFIDFFNSNSDYYNSILSNVRINFEGYNEKDRFEHFFGVYPHNYYVILNLLELDGNFGLSANVPGGKDFYIFITPRGNAGQIPNFNYNLDFLALIYHEFSHPFSNPIVEKYASALKKYEYLLNPIKEPMAGQSYFDWITCVYEHMVRAITIHFTEAKFGKEVSEKIFKKQELGHSFIYIDSLCKRLDEYEASRDIYKTYEEFFPKIIETFANISQADISLLLKNVDRVRYPDIDRIKRPSEVSYDSTAVIILSSHEAGDGNEKVKALANSIRGSISGYRVVTDDEALSLNLQHNNLFVFGTPDGNSFLKKHIGELPLFITDKYIIAGDKIEGDRLQFVLSWVNPFNTGKSMIIYSADNVNDMINYNWSPLKESASFWIAKDLVTLKSADYERRAGVWVPL